MVHHFRLKKQTSLPPIRLTILLGLLGFSVLCLFVSRVHAIRLLAPSVRAIVGNGIGELDSDDRYLWMGTDAGLSRIELDDYEFDNWTTFTTDDGISGNNITAMNIGHGEVWMAAAHDSSIMQSEVGDGISVTRDGGNSWTTFRPERGAGLANTVWGLAVTPTAVWAAAWNAFGLFDTGLIRSKDGGLTWNAINSNPNSNGEFTFSVLADEPRIWVGTAGGIARSTDDGTTWAVSTTADGLTGPWVFTMDIQVINGDSTIWAGSWTTGQPGERYGVVRSIDSGLSWTEVDTFANIQAIDFAFVDSTVWVATVSGLWLSTDAGQHWQQLDQADGLASEDLVSVHALGDTVWTGSAQDGLSTSFNHGGTWEVSRASVPTVTLGGPARADTIETYAFPNPFSPINHGAVRIRYSIRARADVTVEIFDIANQRVISLLVNQSQASGEQFVRWDGRNGRNIRVANGVYFYTISTQTGLKAFGKIVVLD